MKRFAIAAAGSALITAACVSSTPLPPGAPAVLAQLPAECLALHERTGSDGFWFGAFSGAREVRSSFGLSGEDEIRRTFQRRCFASERACRAWLYDMQTENTAFVYTAECRRGLPA
jgi:hypothetical protein